MKELDGAVSSGHDDDCSGAAGSVGEISWTAAEKRTPGASSAAFSWATAGSSGFWEDSGAERSWERGRSSGGVGDAMGSE